MSCLLTSGIAKGCKDNMAGIKTVYLTNSINVTAISPVPDGTSPADVGVIDTITMAASPNQYFYEFTPNKMSSNWVENIQSNVQNGTIAYEQVLTIILGKNEATKRNQIKLIGQAEVVAIVEDRNGKYWLLGEENGLELTGGNSASGTALTDLNGWSLTLTGQEHDPAREVSASIMAALIEP